MRVIYYYLVGLCLAAVSGVPAIPQRIVGGSLTTIEEHPSIASLIYTSDWTTYRQRCGGTIINNRAVLTAAHCTIGDATNRWRVRVGSTYANSGGSVHVLADIINHPDYRPITTDNDVAILQTSTPFTFTSDIQAAPIPGSNYNLADNEIVWAAGWGTTSSNGPASEQLRHVQVWTVNQETCRRRYRLIAMTITDNMLCSGWLEVGGRDQCQGDSGGPLYHNDVVVGVCSFGLGCGRARFPGVNARVSSFTSWIQSNA